MGKEKNQNPIFTLGNLRTGITQCSFETPDNLCPVAQEEVSDDHCFCLKGIIEKGPNGKYKVIETIHQRCGGSLNTVLKISKNPETDEWQFQNIGSFCEKCQLKVSWL